MRRCFRARTEDHDLGGLQARICLLAAAVDAGCTYVAPKEGECLAGKKRFAGAVLDQSPSKEQRQHLSYSSPGNAGCGSFQLSKRSRSIRQINDLLDQSLGCLT